MSQRTERSPCSLSATTYRKPWLIDSFNRIVFKCKIMYQCRRTYIFRWIFNCQFLMDVIEMSTDLFGNILPHHGTNALIHKIALHSSNQFIYMNLWWNLKDKRILILLCQILSYLLIKISCFSQWLDKLVNWMRYFFKHPGNNPRKSAGTIIHHVSFIQDIWKSFSLMFPQRYLEQPFPIKETETKNVVLSNPWQPWGKCLSTSLHKRISVCKFCEHLKSC